MQRISFIALVLCAFCITLLSACGGNSSTSTVDTTPGVDSNPTPTVLPTTATVRISTTGTLDAGTKIGGISVTGALPAGVSVAASADANNPSVLVATGGTVIASGVTGTSASAFATYTAADRKVNILVYDLNGFGIGEFVTVTCTIASGTTTTAANFGMGSFTATDLNGAAITTLAPSFIVDLH